MDKIIEYAQTIYGTDYENKFFTNDAEIYKNKVYFVVSNIGLVEYNPVSNDVVIYGKDYVENHLDTTGESQVSILDTVRCLRVHDDYLILGSSSGLLRFDGTTFKLKTGFKVLYLNEDNNGTLLFNTTKGIFKINDDSRKSKYRPCRIIWMDSHVYVILITNRHYLFQKVFQIFK